MYVKCYVYIRRYDLISVKHSIQRLSQTHTNSFIYLFFLFIMFKMFQHIIIKSLINYLHRYFICC